MSDQQPPPKRHRQLTGKERLQKAWAENPQKFPIENYVTKLQKVPHVHGKMIEEDIVLGTSEKSIHHGLGKEAIGYLVISQDAPEIVYRVPFSFTLPADENESAAQDRIRSNTIILKASGEVTVKLWIFIGYQKPTPPPPPRRPEQVQS